jgi:hypothetical protein
MDHTHNLGLDDLGNIRCLSCRASFTKKALDLALKAQYGDDWQAGYRNLVREKMSMRAKMRKRRYI